MTSSEPPDQTPAQAPPPPPQDPAEAEVEQSQVLAQGHLHPGILLLRAATALKNALLPLVIAWVLSGSDRTTAVILLGFGLFSVAMTMAHALIRYLTFRYWLTTEELITQEGIFNRQERRIPVNRIQDLSFEQTIVRRIFGLVVVTVETASGEGAEARLDSLGLGPAGGLREALQWIRSSQPDSAAPAAEGADAEESARSGDDERELFRVRARDLCLRGLTDNRAGAVLIGIFLLFQYADELGASKQYQDLLEKVWDWAQGLDFSLQVLLVFGLAVGVLLSGWAVSMAASFLLFHDFRLIRRGDVFQRRYGLLTTRARSLPQKKIQRVLIEQNLLRRIFSLAVVRADSAGSGANQSEELKGGLDVVAPMTQLHIARQLVPQLLPGFDEAAMRWRRVSRRLVARMTWMGVVAAIVGMAVGIPLVGPWMLLMLVLIPYQYICGRLLYHNLAFAHIKGHFAMRWGMLGRYRAMIPLRKVQAVALRASPLDRAFGLASIVVFVAGAAPTMLQHLGLDEARQLERDLAAAARRARFVW